MRTPEGFYWIDWRKTSDKYNLSMHISYPNARDPARATEGVAPGSMIMLHGTPVDEEYPEWFFHTLDWTEGCIALTNSDMREIWGLVKDGTRSRYALSQAPAGHASRQSNQNCMSDRRQTSKAGVS